MAILAEELKRLGLSDYLDVLVAEGFDTWEAVLDITESDLIILNVRTGHRRKLQRAISQYRGQAHNYRPPIIGMKRKYIRHPKPDEHAPEKTLSAYVIFSKHVRETLKGQDLSFTEIAKIVGERWQVLSAEAREPYQHQANAGKEKYHAELAEYKKSLKYEAYQDYLTDFKAMQCNGAKGKDSMLEIQAGTLVPSSTHESSNQQLNKELSLAEPNPAMGQVRAKLSATANLPRLPGHSSQLKSICPAMDSLPGLNSACTTDSSSPVLTPSGSATLLEEGSLDAHSSLGIRIRPSFWMHQPVGALLPPYSYESHYHLTTHSPLNQSVWERPRLPSITREGMTVPLEGGYKQDGANYVGRSPILVNDPEFSQALLQPVPSLAHIPSLLARSSQVSSSEEQPQELRHPYSLGALVRAGELARIIDAKAKDKKNPSKL